MKKFCSLIILFVFCTFSYGQDIIKTTSSTEIKAKVLEINESTIKYKKFDYQDGPIYTISKLEVVSIQYQNGTSDVFQSVTQSKQNDVSNQESTVSIPQTSLLQEKAAAKPVQRKYTDVKRFFIYAGASFPIGRFAKMMNNGYVTPMWGDVDNYGGAQVGFNFGLKGRIPVSKHIGITIGGEFIYDDIKESAFTAQEALIADFNASSNYELGVNAYDYRLNSRSKYINTPVLLGVDFTYMLGKGLGISVEADMGVDCDFITPTTYRNNLSGTFVCSEYQSQTNTRIDYYSAEKLKYVYVPAFHFAYQGNISFIFGERWILGLYYLGAIKSSIKCDTKETSRVYKAVNPSNSRIYCQKLGINMIMLKAGVGF
ncbi:MAG: hypothetical protein J5642_05150 [Bacteroidales bacterium]|nr:hypothetical protein [Bacteroidales bacterium]